MFTTSMQFVAVKAKIWRNNKGASLQWEDADCGGVALRRSEKA